MDIVELGKLTAVALSYQNHLQGLNADNLSLAPTQTKRVMETSFAELLALTDLDPAEIAVWRETLNAHTTAVSSNGSLDEISLDVQQVSGQYNRIAEAYGRALSIYQVALGRRG